MCNYQATYCRPQGLRIRLKMGVSESCFLHALYLTLVVACDSVLLKSGVPSTDGMHHLNTSSWCRNIYTVANESFPSWERHLEDLPVCSKESFGNLTKGGWYVTQEGHFLYEPSSCQLLRISGESARRCTSALGEFLACTLSYSLTLPSQCKAVNVFANASVPQVL